MYLNHPWLSKPTGWKPNKPVVGFLKSSYDIGVGCGNNIHATLLQVLLHLHMYVMLCRYAAASSLAFPHIRPATLRQVLLHFYTYLHATLRQVLLHLHMYVMLCRYAAASSLAFPHIRPATLLQVLLHFHIYVTLCCCKFSCTSIHTYMLCKQKESSTCEDQRVKKKRVKKKRVKKNEGQKLGKKWAPKISRKNSDAFIWNCQKMMIFVGRKKRSETRPIETWVR